MKNIILGVALCSLQEADAVSLKGSLRGPVMGVPSRYNAANLLCQRDKGDGDGKSGVELWCVNWLTCIKEKASPAEDADAVMKAWSPADCKEICGKYPAKASFAQAMNKSGAMSFLDLHSMAHDDCIASCKNFQTSLTTCVSTILFERGRVQGMAPPAGGKAEPAICKGADSPCVPDLPVRHQKCLKHRTAKVLDTDYEAPSDEKTSCKQIAEYMEDCEDCSQLKGDFQTQYAAMTGGCMDQLNAYWVASNYAVAGEAAIATETGCHVHTAAQLKAAEERKAAEIAAAKKKAAEEAAAAAAKKAAEAKAKAEAAAKAKAAAEKKAAEEKAAAEAKAKAEAEAAKKAAEEAAAKAKAAAETAAKEKAAAEAAARAAAEEKVVQLATETPQNDDGGGNARYFDRHAPNCPGSFMSRWHMTRPNNKKIKFLSTCLKKGTKPLSGCADKATGWNDDGGGNTIYLDRHDLRCDAGKAMTRWRMTRNGGGNKIEFKHTCCTPPKGLGACQARETPANADGGGKNWYFDRHNIVCPAGQVMTRWHLARQGGNQIKFQYDCCALK